MTRQAFDVVIAGGGMAGATTAAALSDLGHAVLLSEPGLGGGRRLAGELIHPSGATRHSPPSRPRCACCAAA